ncbi:MAG TPA: hypothetical protein VGO45_11310 [Bacteroidia bacterium]|jgi:dihydroorotate dehydrogenase|nr:hypothetical protein [Bacteroidia bacterium]
MAFLSHFLVYLDPGTGSLLLQVLSGSIIAGLMFFKRITSRISRFFSKKENEKPL